MSSGGIIIQRARVLLNAVMDPSFYDTLSEDDKNTVESINAKPELTRTAEDVAVLGNILHAEACGDDD